MSLVNDSRPQQIKMSPHTYPPQFNNPFHVLPATSLYHGAAQDQFLSIDPLSKQSQPAQPNHVSTTPQNPALSVYQNAPIYGSDSLRMNPLAAPAPVSYAGESASFSAAMPPPTLYSQTASSAPGYEPIYAPRTYVPQPLPQQHVLAGRRLSHTDGNPEFFDRQRPPIPGSGPNFGNNFLEALEASKGLMDMGQDLTDATPRAEQRPRADGYGFPAPHSTASSISSQSSYPSYFGSMDSNASGYSSNTDVDSLVHSRTLPGVSNLLSSSLTSAAPPAPQSMMSQFSSKMSTGTPKKHKCKICDKRFTRPSSLQTHVYSHTGEKPFVCPVEGCGRHFSVVSNLRRHNKVHRNENDSHSEYDDHGSPRSTVSTQESISSINSD